VLVGLPFRVIAILLEFWPIARHTPTNRKSTFRPEVLPTDRSTCTQNTPKFSAQQNIFFTRYLISKNQSYPTKAARISCFLKIQITSGRNADFRFVGVCRAIGQNSNKMAITVEGRPASTYPFGVFHTSLGFILCTESEFENDLSVESVPSWVQLSQAFFEEAFYNTISM
jgi:hypothetical protein